MKKKSFIDLKKVIYVIFLGVAFEFITSFALEFVLGFFPRLASEYSNLITNMLDRTVEMVLLVCVVSPVLEELVFRGVILGGLCKLLAFSVANILQALAFAIYHGNIVQGVYAFFLGMLIGLIKKKSGGLIYCIIFHMSLNITGMYLSDILQLLHIN